MPSLIMMFGGLLLNLAGSIVGRVLIALGVGYVTYSGFNVLIDYLLTYIKSEMALMPAEILSFLGWLWLDKAIGMVFSAYSAAMVVKLAGGTSITKMFTKGA